MPFGEVEWIPNVASFVCALTASWFVWSMTGAPSGGLVQSVVYGGLVVGAIGLAGGFFGPLLLTPDANQGPLLGLFITGPLGTIVGPIGGLMFWLMTRASRGRDA